MKLKKVLVFILIILIISLGFVGIAYFGVNEVVTVEVKELSIMQQKFVVQSPYYQEDANSEDTNGEEDESSESQNSESNSKNGNGSSSSSSRKNSKKTYGYGTSDYQGTTTVTPKIKIPRTGINLTIYPEMSLSAMERGAVIFATDNGLNEVGNTVISAHNTVNSRFFSKNARLQIGDLIYVTDPSGRQLTYTVYNKYITGPNDASYIDRDTDGDTEISLNTCTDDGKQRIIIWAYAI